MKWFSRIWNIENIKIVRRVIVSVVGATVLLIGVALLVLPGPAFIVIPIGLAILATEYAWARRWLKKVRRMASDVVPGAIRHRDARERPRAFGETLGRRHGLPGHLGPAGAERGRFGVAHLFDFVSLGAAEPRRR